MTFLCRHEGDGEAVLDTLAVRVGFLEFLADTLHVRTRLFEVRLQLLVIAVHLLVEREVRIVNLVVLLPGVRLRTLHADIKTVVRKNACEVLRQAALTDELLHGFLHLRTQSLDRCFMIWYSSSMCASSVGFSGLLSIMI